MKGIQHAEIFTHWFLFWCDNSKIKPSISKSISQPSLEKLLLTVNDKIQGSTTVRYTKNKNLWNAQPWDYNTHLVQGQSIYEKEMWKYRKSQSSWWLLSRIVFNTHKGIRPQTQETQNPSMEEWRWAWSPIPSWETFDIWLLLEEAIESQLFYWPHFRTRVAPRNSQSDWVCRGREVLGK